jgi:NAD(P)-dependent dehydrogenase (short-subunit alcohol dehydrogenase family)
LNLSGKVAVVTGASTGIGRAIAQAVAASGGRAALVGRNRHGLTETQLLIEGGGGEARVFIADLRDVTAIDQLARDVVAAYGPIDILVNCAGVWHDSSRAYYGPPLWEIPADELNDVLDVGIRAPMFLCRAFLPGMVERKRGKVINISGTFSSGGAKWLHYYVSKKALEDFTTGLADELRPYEIQVNCISPADVKTPALRKWFPDDYETALDPSEVAKLAVFLMSAEADHITGSCTIIRNKAVH